ncbi:MAG: TRAM domain-containing protein [candidate division WOR-3 bacterium]
MLFKKKSKTYFIDETALGDGRVVALIEKQLFDGKFILAPYPIYDVVPPNTLNDANYLNRIKENVERISKFVNTIVIKKPISKAEFLKLIKKNNAIIITPNAETQSNITSSLPQSTVNSLNFIVLNELYEILKPDYLPGTELKITVSKKGKEEDEGIGYLDNGIKVIVSGGAKALGKDLEVVVVGSIETKVGKLIFAKPKYAELE